MTNLTTTENEPAHHEFGPSSLYRRQHCPGSYRMEQGMPDCADLSGIREHGTTMHAAVVNKEMRDDLEASDLRLLEICDEIIEPYISWPIWASEARLEIRAPFTDDLILFGTCDFYAISEDGAEGMIGDWKFGYNEVDEPAENIQLAAYALALFQQYPTLRRVTTIIGQPTIRHEDHPQWTFTEPQSILKFILKIITACKDDTWKLKAGSHCLYCNAKSTCPAFQAFSGVVMREPQPVITPENAATILAQAKLADRLIGELKDRLKVQVINAGGAYGDLCMEERPGNRYIRSTFEAYQALRPYFTPDEFMQACNISPAQLDTIMAKKLVESGEVTSAAAAKRRLAELLPMPRGKSKQVLAVRKDID